MPNLIKLTSFFICDASAQSYIYRTDEIQVPEHRRTERTEMFIYRGWCEIDEDDDSINSGSVDWRLIKLKALDYFHEQGFTSLSVSHISRVHMMRGWPEFIRIPQLDGEQPPEESTA